MNFPYLKTCILLVALISHAFLAHAQDDDEIQYSVSAGCFAVDDDGFLYAAGGFEGVVSAGRHTILSTGSDDVFLAKFAPDGQCLWVVKGGGRQPDYAEAMDIDAEGNIYIAGRFGDQAVFDFAKVSTNADNEFFVAKYSPSGDLMAFKKSRGVKDSDNGANAIMVTSTGTCYVGASFPDGASLAGKDFKGDYVLKFNSSLEYLSSQKVGGQVNGIIRDKTKNVYLTGSFSGTGEFGDKSLTSAGATDIYLAKYNSKWDCEWVRKVGGGKYDVGKNVALDKSGNVLMVAEYTDSITITGTRVAGSGGTDVLLMKYSPAGEWQWYKAGGGPEYDFVEGLVAHANGDISIAGSFSEYIQFGEYSVGGLDEDFFYIRFASNGTIKVGKEGTNNNNADAVGLVIGKDKQTYMLGNFDRVLRYDKKEITSNGGATCIYSATVNDNAECTSLRLMAEADKNFDLDPNADYTDFQGKLLMGKDVKKPLVNQHVSLLEESGELIQNTVTDKYGDFSFKNIDAKKTYNINLGVNDNVPEDEPIYLAKQTGEIVKPISRDDDRYFKFEILPKEIVTMSKIEEEEDPVAVLKGFAKESDDTEVVIKNNIYYEDNSFNLSREAKLSVYGLVKTMKSNRNLHVEIAAYTDSKGDDSYNLDLSTKRANAVLEYITSKGIEDDRVTAVGYGESKIINRCVNGVTDCSEKEHSVNRRTEFKFIKK